MKGRAHLVTRRACLLLVASCFLTPVLAATAQAATIAQSGNLNVTATVMPTAPTEAAFIDQPQTNSHVQTTPLVVIGRCGAGLLVRIFNNGQLAGSVVCEPDSTFTANIILGFGKNTLNILNYDVYDQPGPTSPDVIVYVDPKPVTPTAASGDANDLIAQAVGTAEQSGASAPFDPTHSAERIFEGTILEPVAKLLDLNATVSVNTNQATTIALNSIMALGVLVLIALFIL